MCDLSLFVGTHYDTTDKVTGSDGILAQYSLVANTQNIG